MPMTSDSAVQITAFSWAPPFAQGVVRDLRVRWALEEAGREYGVALLDPRQPRDDDYYKLQPFGQVPAMCDDHGPLFESGAIVLSIAEDCKTLLPDDPAARRRAIAWVFAALNSVEPQVQQLAGIDIFHVGEAWVAERRPQVIEMVEARLARLENWLKGKTWLEAEFTTGDLMMTTVLRILRDTDLLSKFPVLGAYQARCESRPAFGRALAAQLACFETVDA